MVRRHPLRSLTLRGDRDQAANIIGRLAVDEPDIGRIGREGLGQFRLPARVDGRARPVPFHV